MRNWIIISCVAIVLTSCLDKEDFSYIPSITYEEISGSDNSLIVKITFTDGDGDIGLREDEGGVYAPCTDYHYNLFVDPYVKVNGEYIRKRFFDYDSECYPRPDTGFYPDTIGYYFRTAYLVPEGKDKSLEGDIFINLNDALITFEGDTVKFEVMLMDRAHNKSNVVETDVVIP